MKISIIGRSSQKGLPRGKFTVSLFEKMVNKSLSFIKDELKEKPENITLVSGGSSFADHVAVYLFLNYNFQGLELYLPCRWKMCQFEDNGDTKWYKNPGKLLNKQHKDFSMIYGKKSLDEIEECQKRGAILDSSYFGFHNRNNKIANCDLIIAFTWESEEPSSGGTGYIWKRCKDIPKYHFALCEF